jgi:hypothetical protein
VNPINTDQASGILEGDRAPEILGDSLCPLAPRLLSDPGLSPLHIASVMVAFPGRTNRITSPSTACSQTEGLGTDRGWGHAGFVFIAGIGDLPSRRGGFCLARFLLIRAPASATDRAARKRNRAFPLSQTLSP